MSNQAAKQTSLPKKLAKQTLCDWSKSDFTDYFDQLEAIVRDPCFACIKCGRAATAKKWLCKAKPLTEQDG